MIERHLAARAANAHNDRHSKSDQCRTGKRTSNGNGNNIYTGRCRGYADICMDT